jgi:hypothetical protein
LVLERGILRRNEIDLIEVRPRLLYFCQSLVGIGRGRSKSAISGNWPQQKCGTGDEVGGPVRSGNSTIDAEQNLLPTFSSDIRRAFEVATTSRLAMSPFVVWYAANFGSYNKTYGSLGAVVGLMTWIWLSSIVVLIGAMLNAEIEHQTMRDTTVGRPQSLVAAEE